MKKQRFFSVPTVFTITYLGNGTTRFAPQFRTSVSTTIRWKPDDGPETVTGPTTIHSFSYVPSPGQHRCTVRVTGGYNLIYFTDFSEENILYAPVYQLTRLSNLYFRQNPNLKYNINSVPFRLKTLLVDFSLGVFGSIVNLPRSLVDVGFYTVPLITGCLSDVFFVTGLVAFVYTPLVSGCISDLNPNLTTLRLYNNPQFTIGDVSKYTKIRDLQLHNMSWSQAQVDQVIDYLYQAVVADPNHFTYSNPVLYIHGNNAAPSGTYQYSAAPSTGLEKVYYLCHLAAHHWTITWTGGSGP